MWLPAILYYINKLNLNESIRKLVKLSRLYNLNSERQEGRSAQMHCIERGLCNSENFHLYLNTFLYSHVRDVIQQIKVLPELQLNF